MSQTNDLSNYLKISTFDPITKQQSLINLVGLQSIKNDGMLFITLEGLDYTLGVDHFDGKKRIFIYKADEEEATYILE